MSLPSFDNMGKIPSLEEALTAIVMSIAMEETALAKILEAESEKISFATAHLGGSADDMHMLLLLNESVGNVIANIVEMQRLLKKKLRLALCHLPCPAPCPKPCPPCPPHPPIPPPKPCKKCSAVFMGDSRFLWGAGRTLALSEDPCHAHKNTCCIYAMRRGTDAFLILPPDLAFKVIIDIALRNPQNISGAIELVRQSGSGNPIFSKRYEFAGQSVVEISDIIMLPRAGEETQLSLRLISAAGLGFDRAVVRIIEI